MKTLLTGIWHKSPWWLKWYIGFVVGPNFAINCCIFVIWFLPWFHASIHATIVPMKEQRDLQIKNIEEKAEIRASNEAQWRESVDRKLDILIERTK
jgi:hypothetical protein